MTDDRTPPKRKRPRRGAEPPGHVAGSAVASHPEAANLVAVIANLAARAAAMGCDAIDVAEAVVAAMTQGAPAPIEALASRRDIQVRLLRDDIPLPGYRTEGAIAWDLCHPGPEPLVVKPGRKIMVESGVCLHIPDPGVGAFLFPRSSTGWKGLALANTTGVIDTDYQGQILIPIRNARRRKNLVIEPFERIVQLVFMPVARFSPVQVEEFPSETARGTGGFGSTGKR